MKVCARCEVDYPEPLEVYFSKKSRAKDGLQNVCKVCHSKYVKKHYKKNKTYYKKKAFTRNKSVRIENIQFVVDYLKEHPCVDCGEKDPIVLDFDHVRGKKHKDISTMSRNSCSIERLKEEIAKCEVRCANCHRRRTAEQFGWYRKILI